MLKVFCPNFEKRGGLITVITQDNRSGQILMCASTDMDGYFETLRTGIAVYFSTSRNRRWMKGEESGAIQKVHRVSIDCDGDAVIYHVEQLGEGACHTNAKSCFYRDAICGKMLCYAPGHSEKERLQYVTTEVHPSLLLD